MRTLLVVQPVNGCALEPRLKLLAKYGAQIGLIVRPMPVEPGAGSHRTNAETRSDPSPTSEPSATPNRASVAPMAAGDDPSDSPPDPDPEWIEAELREQSRREY